MYILGIYCGHNSTAVIMKDGKIIAAASEERFNGIKNFTGYPKFAIRYVLRESNVMIKNIDFVTISHLISVPVTFKKYYKDKSFSVLLLTLLSFPLYFIRNMWGFFEYFIPQIRPVGRLFYKFAAYSVGKYTHYKEILYLENALGISKEKIKAFDHHLSHAASAYYASPYNTTKSLVLTLDGEGDLLSGSVNIFENEQHKTIAKIPRDNSLGYIFEHVTSFLGMQPKEHEYKVMGLAAYVKSEIIEKLYKRIESIVRVDPDTLVINSQFNTIGFTRYLRRHMQSIRFDLVAAIFQKLLEDKIALWVKQCVKKTGIHTVVLAGGVFMNVKVNQRIAELSEVKELFVLPSCGDESSIIGSSYLGYIEACKSQNVPFLIPPIKDIYWGPAFKDQDIEIALKESDAYRKFKVKKVKKIERYIAKLLARGVVVARLSGRMEFGARALGNRSILADPRNYEAVHIINEQIKNRDFWMPFAPSILFERQTDYIKNPKKLSAYYMMLSFETTEKARAEIKAATHSYDFTARPQFVTKDFNRKYYTILKEFEKLTGVGGILNTSFNLHGYPIVLGPKEALKVFMKSGITHLVLENYLVIKK
ncbi:hypothetical protein A3B39_05470 [Candidatus Daviesbacteria bacterium RIFCSPLOWO2_01_FULL_37_10]|nr:MAG: hypothetical protein A3B39_05470 [Candidatus Daviesbacteria bacterium RIFCSPLOWO2_01_FULL_37_10]